MNILYIVLALAIGFFIGRRSKKTISPSTPEELRELRESAEEAISERTEERKDRILEMMRSTREHHEELKACGLEEERRGIDRRDVEELLGVSKPTALAYLNELEEEGKIKQIGVTKGVYYMLV